MTKLDDLKKFYERKRQQAQNIQQNIAKKRGEMKASELKRLRKERIRLEGEAQLADIRHKEQMRIEQARSKIERSRPKQKPMMTGNMFGSSSLGGSSDMFGIGSIGSKKKKKGGGFSFDI